MTRTEHITSAVLLVILVCVAGAVAVYRLQAGSPAATLLSLLPQGSPAGWQRRGEPEEYPAYRLNEKINGEDMVYLSRGCLGLAWTAYVNKEREGSFISVSIYDMGEKGNARSIYEHIRGPLGPQVKAVQIGDEACTISGSVFFRNGRYYVQLQASIDDLYVYPACEYLARQIVSHIQAAAP